MQHERMVVLPLHDGMDTTKQNGANKHGRMWKCPVAYVSWKSHTEHRNVREMEKESNPTK